MHNTNYSLFPEINPFSTQFLRTNDGHEIYYEISGNPQGYPVVFLHGGPGSGCNPSQRRFFDPKFYQIILIDQRGCGRSKPVGETNNNNTQSLVDDLEAIRKSLDITNWLVFGGSWGSTLALSYAIQHPERTSGLILRGIFLARPNEMQWFLGQITRFYPDVWETLIAFLDSDHELNVLEAYSKLIFSNDASINYAAAKAWNAYESAIMRLLPPEAKDETLEPVTQEQIDTELARARIQIHYIEHDCFVNGAEMLEQAKSLTMPTYIVQGRYDMVCPPETAWELKKSMPHAEFSMIPDAGHSAMEDGTCSALVKATETFKSLVTL